DRWVEHKTVATGVQIGTSDQHHAIQHVEYALQVFLIGEGWQDQWNATGRNNGIVIACGDIAKRWGILLRAAVVGVDSNNRFGSQHVLHSFADTGLCHAKNGWVVRSGLEL